MTNFKFAATLLLTSFLFSLKAQFVELTPLAPITENSFYSRDIFFDQEGNLHLFHGSSEFSVTADDGVSWETVKGPEDERFLEVKRFINGDYIASFREESYYKFLVLKDNLWSALEVEGDTLFEYSALNVEGNEMLLIHDDKVYVYDSEAELVSELPALSTDLEDACNGCRQLIVSESRILLLVNQDEYRIYDRNYQFLNTAYGLDDNNLHITSEGDILVVLEIIEGFQVKTRRSRLVISRDNGDSFQPLLDIDEIMSNPVLIGDRFYFRYRRFKTGVWHSGHDQAKIGCYDLNTDQLISLDEGDGMNSFNNNRLMGGGTHLYHNIHSAIIKYDEGDFEDRRVITREEDKSPSQVKKLRRAEEGTLYAETKSFLYKSTDAGQSWEMIFDHYTVIDFEVDNKGRLLVLTNDRLLRSDDLGLTFDERDLSLRRTGIDLPPPIDYPFEILMNRGLVQIKGMSEKFFQHPGQIGCFDCWSYHPPAIYAFFGEWDILFFGFDPYFYDNFPYEAFMNDPFDLPFLSERNEFDPYMDSEFMIPSVKGNIYVEDGGFSKNYNPSRMDDDLAFGFNLEATLFLNGFTESAYSDNEGWTYTSRSKIPDGNIFPSSSKSSIFVIGDDFHYLEEKTADFVQLQFIDKVNMKEVRPTVKHKIHADTLAQYLLTEDTVYQISTVEFFDSRLSGELFLDVNQDCLSDGETNISEITELRIERTGGGEALSIMKPVINGEYDVELPPGEWTLTPVLNGLSVNPCSAEVALSLAAGQDLVFDFGYENLNACPVDEPTVVVMQICEGENYLGYDTSGSYSQVLFTEDGCDSLIDLRLEVLPVPRTEVEVFLCTGETFMGKTYLFNESPVGALQTYYTDTATFESSQGCDSLVRYTIWASSDSFIDEENVTLCEGEDYFGIVDAGRHLSNKDYTECVRVFVRVNESFMSEESETICAGDEYEGHTVSGTYTDTLVAVNGCDSLLVLHLDVTPAPIEEVEMSICKGESYEGYDRSGSYEDTFERADGCDSIRSLQLEVIDEIVVEKEDVICQGDESEGYTESGIYMDTFTSTVTGCDSTRILHLEVQSTLEKTLDITICAGDSYEGYETTGTYVDGFVTDVGCDSTRTLLLEVLPVSTSEMSQVICDGDVYESYSVSGTYEDTFTSSVSGCDSIRILHLEVQPPLESWEVVELCIGESFGDYSQPGDYEEQHVSDQGCDSIHHLSIRHVDRGDPICALEFDTELKRFSETDFLNLHPSPARFDITLTIDKPSRLPSELFIYSVDHLLIRKMTLTDRETRIDLSNLADGLYLFYVKNGHNVFAELVTKM